jgi:DNA polymerase III alpha subunit
MIQLKVRTEYSFGQTFAPLDKLIACLKEQGCTAAGIVDGSTWGHVNWHKKCRAAGIKPLLGVELVVSDEEDTTPRMWFLAKNLEGLRELYKFSSKAHQFTLATKRGKVPALGKLDVKKMSDNILKFAGDITDADFLKEVGAIIDISPASKILEMKKRAITEQHGLQLVGISDNAYAKPEDVAIFELIGNGLKMTPQYLLNEIPFQDIAQEIAGLCLDYDLPTAPMIRAEGDIELMCREGIKFRKMEEQWTDEYEQRLLHELKLIRSKDFDSYFVIVADMVHYAKQHMLVGPSRGSSAGSLVCYLMRITEVDPVPTKLFFERFIDVSRTDLPDIDLDFPDSKRHLVFEYMANKYGEENTAKIGTISQYKPKSALIAVCKKLNIPPAATAAVKVAMIERSSADSRANNCLQDTLETTDPGKTFISMYPQAGAAALIEGHASHTGVHAAGLLVCNDEITNYATVDGNGIAHIEKGAAEELGLLKVDVLGLRTLSVLEDSGIAIDWYNLGLNDPATYEIFSSGRYCGIFQFEGNAMRAVGKEVVIKSMTQIDAVTALARPGPFGGGVTKKYIDRSNGEKYDAIHPLVASHMKETYGLPIYQEQVMAMVREIGKFDWEEASFIRKSMAKRLGIEFFNKFYIKFEAGAIENGLTKDQAKEAWHLISTMGTWCMNKAHTYSYALISYWTAYLKAHHPLEFAASNLRNSKDEDSALELLREMVREGLEYVAFDIEKSALNWSAIDGVLYGGFTALKGIGESKAAKLIEARDAGKLTKKQRDDVAACENIFADLNPLMTKYGAMYDDPKEAGVLTDKIWHVADLTEGIPHGEERVLIAELIYKNQRDANEDVNVKKRNGKIETGQTIFVDLRLRDDTGMIGGRINRFDYLRIGKELLEEVPIGAHLLIRAKFFNGIRYCFISKWKRLDV